ncbi:hypothetical protein CONPUDRAFT_144222 [Coniophora puteana RWD-64-598 SS2]|uniref:Uncharacterized protein n=1 Tax=Coniophora puteana (strain RWD-64-598) TaxID=741705 RepID=A0A5M3MQH5_CONPW|nr:uncharacterized protein CONPUDRAFT_144222 [Coniophora puteana RWD-64-598 SS2]EIW81458.1 hypothetical protein CONPUDRAFT_144222 [Coniophora puteana RWD-64-598 SS2]
MASQELQLEISTYVGNALLSFLYGVHLCIQKPSRGWVLFYIAYGGILLLMITIYVATIQVFGLLLWIIDRGTPGGPPIWLHNNKSSWLGVLASATTTVSNMMGDGLMLRRCFIILQGERYYLVLPALLYAGTFEHTRDTLNIVSSIATVIEDAGPSSNDWATTLMPWDIAWIVCTASFNGIVTALICYHIIKTNRAANASASVALLQRHTGVVSMMVEGTIPFTVLGIAFVISEACESVSQICISRVWTCFCVLSQQFIIMRIAMGLAWSKTTEAELSVNVATKLGDLNKLELRMLE